ncbi:MAG TPA: hypothetical protein VFS00_24090, partial [Polyangiaceae bacterium]|nr:hypothetical protein [Polyangiaceae bacterium]
GGGSAGGGSAGGGGAGGNSAGGGGAAAGPAVPASASRLAYSCGPIDQPVQAVVVGVPGQSCSAEPGYPFLILPFDFWGTDVDIVPGTHEFSKADLDDFRFGGIEPGPAQGLAYDVGDYAPAKGAAPVRVERATVILRTWDGDARLTGSYDVTLADGSRLAGEFDANRCEETVTFCG